MSLAMSPERWQQIQAIFDAALQQGAADRTTFLEKACDGDAALRAEVQNLLNHEELAQRHDFLTPLTVTRQAVNGCRGDPRTAAPQPPRLADYEILEEIGRGGMSIVYKARHVKLDRLVALKMILNGEHAGPQELARFRAEVLALARLQHANIVRIYDVGEQDGRPFFAMEYVDGGSLKDHLDGTPLPPREAAGLIETLARATHAAHRCGIIHRDLKPGNILLQEDLSQRRKDAKEDQAEQNGEGAHGSSLLASFASLRLCERSFVLKIADFGLAKHLDADKAQTHTGAFLGTPSYAAPEQASGQVRRLGPATDVYALGAILYELLAGRAPFRAESPLETLRQVTSDDPVPPRTLAPRLPRDLETICLKCLRKDPRQRYPSADELAQDLQRFLNGESIRAQPDGPLGAALKWVRRRPLWAALYTVCLVAGVSLAAAGVSLWQTARSLDRALGIATAESTLAQENEARALCHLYATDLWRAHQLWGGGDIQPMRDLLDRHRPGQGPDPPGFEWHYCSRLARTSDAATLHGHEGEVHAVAFSPDGQALATAGQDGTVRLWRTAGRQEQTVLSGHTGPVVRLEFLSDGATLAAVGADQTVRLWDVARGLERPPPVMPAGSVRVLALSPDGRLLAVGLADQSVKVWETRTGHLRWDLGRHVDQIEAVAFAPTQALVAAASRDGCARVWDLQTGTERANFHHEGALVALAFSPSGELLAAGGQNGVLRCFRVAPGVSEAVLGPGVDVHRGHTGAVRCLAFSGDGETLASGSDDGTVRLWSPRSPVAQNVFRGHTDRVLAVAFSPDGHTVASAGGDGVVKLWDPARRQDCEPLLTPVSPAGPVAFLDGGRTVAALGRDQAVLLLDASTGQLRERLTGHRGPVLALAAAPAGDLLATAGLDRTVRVWDASGQRRAVLPSPEVARCLAFSRDGRLLAAGLHDGRLALWDTATAAERGTWPVHQGPVLAVAFAPDGNMLASGGADQVVHFSDVAAGRASSRTVAHDAAVTSLCFSPDGRLLATIPERREVLLLWDAATGERLAAPRDPGNQPSAVAFTPDGRTVAVAAGLSLRLYDAKTRNLTTNIAHFSRGEHVTHLNFSPDGRTLATCGGVRGVELWDTATWKMKQPPGQPLGPVRGLTFSPDGSTLLVGSAAPSIIATIRSPVPFFGGKEFIRDQLVGRPDEVRQWDLASGQELPPLPGQPLHGAFCLARTPDGKGLLSGSHDGAVWCWDLAARQPRPRLFVSDAAKASARETDLAGLFNVPIRPEHYEAVRALAVSADGRLFAVAFEEVSVRRDGYLPEQESGRVQLWDLVRGKLRTTLEGKVGHPACVAFSPDGAFVAANDGGDVLLWDAVSGALLRRLAGHKEPVCCLAFSADGKLLATGAQDRHIHLWDLAGETRRVLVGHADFVASVAFTPDGRTLASGSWDGTVRLWHVPTALELAVLERHSGKVHTVAFSPDGSTLASGGESFEGSGEVYLWSSKWTD
jgi:WD40 repeat protein/serine/threonine protein kinase